MVKVAIQQLKDAIHEFRAWARENPWRTFLLVAGAVVFLWVLFQTIRLDNMGFEERTFWNWMELLLVPAALALVGLWFSRVQKQTELETAQDRQWEKILDDYLEKIATLMLDRGLGPATGGSEVQMLARTWTIVTLRRLDASRNGQAVQFLQESKLIHTGQVDLSRSDLREASLSGVILSRAHLTEANLRGADLSEATLIGADLSDTDLRGTNLKGTELIGANLTGANLSGSDLIDTVFDNAELTSADLSGANLSEAILFKADLRGANLAGANLRGVFLDRKDLTGTYLKGADMSKVNLEGAKVSTEQLLQARSLEGATMPDGTKYEAWIKRQKSEKGASHEQDD